VPPRQLGPQRHFRFIGRFRGHIAQAVGNAVDMGVHANPVLAVSQRHDQIGRLAADALDAEQIVQMIRHPRTETVDQLPAGVLDGPGFIAVKADRKNRPGDLFTGNVQHLFGCGRERKEPFGGLGRHFVLGAQAQKRGYENNERIALMLCQVGNDGHLAQFQLLF